MHNIYILIVASYSTKKKRAFLCIHTPNACLFLPTLLYIHKINQNNCSLMAQEFGGYVLLHDRLLVHLFQLALLFFQLFMVLEMFDVFRMC